MIREIPKEEWKMTDMYELNFDWDGHWVVLWPPVRDGNGTGYVVAYGDGTNEDRDALRRHYVLDRYNGQAFLKYGHKPSEVITCFIQ